MCISDVSCNLEQSKLTARFATAKTLTGTRSHHCLISTAEDELNMISAEQMITTHLLRVTHLQKLIP